MKLFYSSTSPYARKVRIAALEKNIALELETVVAADNPPVLHAANPSGKVPALVTDNGEPLAESGHICLYFDMLQPKPRLLPADAAAALPILRRDALAIGMMDASVRHVFETRRAPELQSTMWLERHINAILRTLSVLEKEKFGADFTLDQVTLAASLGYLDLRFAQLNWKEKHPALAAWFTKISERPSVKETVPVA